MDPSRGSVRSFRSSRGRSFRPRGGLARCFLLAGAVLGCARPSGIPPAIGVAYVTGDLPPALAAWVSTFRHITILQDSAPYRRGGEGDVERARRLVGSPRIVGVVGPQDSRAMLATEAVYRQAGIPVINPTANSDLLVGKPNLFLLLPPLSVEGAMMGRFAASALGVRRATVVYGPDAYGTGLRHAVVAELEAKGIAVLDQVLLPEDCVNKEEAGSILARATLQRGRPDLVILAVGNTPAQCIVPPLFDAAPGIRFLAGDGLVPGSWWHALARQRGDSLYLIQPWHPDVPDSASQAFVQAFHTATGAVPRIYHALIYDALRLFDTAVAVAGPRPQAIARYLASLGTTRPPFPGITGLISFSGAPRTRFVVVRVGADSTRLVPWRDPVE